MEKLHTKKWEIETLQNSYVYYSHLFPKSNIQFLLDKVQQ